jgi:hypothetical protein
VQAEEHLKAVPADVSRFGSSHRLGLLLMLILVSVSVQLAAPDTDVSRLIIVLLQGATLLGALLASGIRRRYVNFAGAAVAAGIVTALVAVLEGGDISAMPARVVTLLLVATAPAAIAVGLVRDVRREEAVTIRTMFGVLCIYLLIGMFFSFCFNVTQQITGDPFFSNGVNGNVSDFLYFSFTTITTTGYGDFTAGTRIGRSFAVIEALIGQIYLVTIVALIVANLRPRRRVA